MANWNLALQVEMFGHCEAIPLWNAWGKNFPAVLDEQMVELLDIAPEHRVLDVGGGHYPFRAAALNVDAYVDDHCHRSGHAPNRLVPLVAGRAERIPVRDRSFDFVITRHTMEHVVDPEAVAREMTRVAPRGFVETPSPVHETALGWPGHLWLVTKEEDTLVFRRRPWLRSPLLHALRPFWWFDAAARFHFELKWRNVTMTQHPWEGELVVRVEDDGRWPNYEEPENTALAHLDYALNALALCAPPVHEVEQDIAVALKNRPDWAIAHNAMGVVLWSQNHRERAIEHFRRAAELEPGTPEYTDNARLRPDSRHAPILVFLPDDPSTPAYPDLRQLQKQLRIGPETSVLELASGCPWFPQSEVGRLLPDGTIRCDRQRYDVAIVRDGLAEVGNLRNAFHRIEALAPRGYIELPTRTTVSLLAHPDMQWFAEQWGSDLIALRRPDSGSACHHLLAVLQRVHNKIAERLAANPYGVIRHGKVWEGSIGIEIRSSQGYDAFDPAQRREAENAYRSSLARAGVAEREQAASRALSPTRQESNTTLGVSEHGTTGPRASSASDDVGDGSARSASAAARPAIPIWVLPLAEMLTTKTGKRTALLIDCQSLAGIARERGWNLGNLTKGFKKADLILLWHAESATPETFVRLANEAREGTLLLLGFPPTDQPELLRARLETLFGAAVHFLDPDPECARLLAILWNRRTVNVRQRSLITLHRNALRMMGGGEAVVFRTLLQAGRDAGIRADVTVALRLEPRDHDMVHVVSLYQPDHVETIRSWKKPKVLMPIHWDGPRVRWVTAVLPYILSPDRTEEERAQLLKLYAERALAANGITIEQATEPREVVEALRAVRDLGDRLIATGPQELEAITRAFGPPPMPAASIRLGIDTDLYLNASPKEFESAYGLRDFVLCVGRVEPMKNQLMLAYAMRNFERPLVLIGGAADPAYLALCKHWGGDRLLHLSNQPPWMVASAYKAAACHVLPSWWEVPGLVSVEAAAAGCPVVATDCGSIRHYLGDDAWYCDPANPESIREAVEKACGEKNSARVARLREICSEYTHRRCAEAYRLVYDELVGQPRRRLLLVPDWSNPNTWQPFVKQYLQAHKPEDPVTLCLLVDEPTGAGVRDAQAVVETWLHEEGFVGQSFADIELVDIASVGRVVALIECGSEAEAKVKEALGATESAAA